MEPGLDELYQMSMEQEAELVMYGWRPCGMDEVERFIRDGTGGSMGRNRRYRRVRIHKFRLKRQIP